MPIQVSLNSFCGTLLAQPVELEPLQFYCLCFIPYEESRKCTNTMIATCSASPLPYSITDRGPSGKKCLTTSSRTAEIFGAISR